MISPFIVDSVKPTPFVQMKISFTSLIHFQFNYLEILISLEECYREVELILYYPSDDYQYFLDQRTPFHLKKEITLPNYHKDHRERFLIYGLGI